MIMNPEMTAFKTMFDYDLEPEVYSFRLMEALIRAAEKEGITGWPVHIKLDTGMHRLGFDPEKDITSLTITPAEGEEGDNDTYAHVECECWPEDSRYGKPKIITVTFNLSKNHNNEQ
jgi:alanine racemase